ncbi:hypothetical protein EST38_g4758 [Candolleomyces aberdarensis]|uniref:Uncharacterized protein n=1 Tax=Candolleomyces aberdarensis TaxID=2316362 RepID=A0A4Q2DLT3_9AGAR|nr:hypothetical protein EST38_g4758 [Candolleomyces aberdarensis]
MGSFVLWLELCEALRPLENTLKTLALDVHLQDVPTPFDQDPPLHLSQLEELALCQPPDVICQLLGFIRLPTSTKLYFQNVQPHGLDRLAFPKILSAVSTFHSPATSLQLSQLSLYVKYNSRHPIGEVEIKGYFHDQPIGFNRDWNFLTEPPSITLEQRNVLPEEIDSILSLSIDEGIWGISGYSISELENLELMLGVGWRQGPQFLWDTLAQLPKLKNIRIRNTIPGGLFISLGQDSESIRLILEGKPKEVAPENSDPPKSQSPQRERSFASLCSITFENVKFYRTPKNDPSTKAIGQLLGNLRLRHELGCPLERLAFRGCQSVRKAELVELARYVSELEK